MRTESINILRSQKSTDGNLIPGDICELGKWLPIVKVRVAGSVVQLYAKYQSRINCEK